jgi:hypothetical protein
MYNAHVWAIFGDLNGEFSRVKPGTNQQFTESELWHKVRGSEEPQVPTYEHQSYLLTFVNSVQ